MKQIYDISFDDDWRNIELDELVDVYDSVGFGVAPGIETPKNFMELLFSSGVYGFFAFDQDRLVGAARVYSDNFFSTWITEICVHQEWQRRGIGCALLGMINARFHYTALYVNAFRGQEAFFAKRGLSIRQKLVACGRRPIGLI
jgi:ribosomal protein S18 acetylase RimI-like enzyme